MSNELKHGREYGIVKIVFKQIGVSYARVEIKNRDK